MVKKTSIVLAGVAAAAGGAIFGWTLTAAPSQILPTTTMAPSPQIQTAAIGEKVPVAPAPVPVAPAPVPAPTARAEVPAPTPTPPPAAAAPAQKEPKSRKDTTGADTGNEGGMFRLDTPSTKISLDPKRGKVSFKTPYGSINLDGDKREARFDAAPLYLGLGW